MKKPDLSRIVETHILVEACQQDDYLAQLRKDVLQHIRKLQSSGHIGWFSFLLHPAKQVAGCAPEDETLVFHVRLEPSSDLTVEQLISLLPDHFRNPHSVTLAQISGLNSAFLHRSDWAEAWRIVGESAEWVLELLETHADQLPPQQTIQFLHFITNLLGLGNTCVYAPNRQVF
jgi:hypothetical protein